jgi:hypothetical protein
MLTVNNKTMTEDELFNNLKAFFDGTFNRGMRVWYTQNDPAGNRGYTDFIVDDAGTRLIVESYGKPIRVTNRNKKREYDAYFWSIGEQLDLPEVRKNSKWKADYPNCYAEYL